MEVTHQEDREDGLNDDRNSFGLGQVKKEMMEATGYLGSSRKYPVK